MKKGRNMKRFISILMTICLCTAAIFADDPGDEYDDGYIYEQNGAGDQFLSIDLFANFPLNFNGQLYVGAGASISYYRFITGNIALGGDLLIGYNLTIGEKPLITVPITLGILYQPYVGKFEFPMSLGIGVASSTCQTMTYFPSLAVKAYAGAYYRFAEGWSAGLNANAFWIPQWFQDSQKNFNGLFASFGLGARYHF
ncbi:MAG: hypothetical protein K6C97_11520 [Treponema sp.]|nr:hypothetical protein [Treponema sp.]